MITTGIARLHVIARGDLDLHDQPRHGSRHGVAAGVLLVPSRRRAPRRAVRRERRRRSGGPSRARSIALLRPSRGRFRSGTNCLSIKSDRKSLSPKCGNRPEGRSVDFDVDSDPLLARDDSTRSPGPLRRGRRTSSRPPPRCAVSPRAACRHGSLRRRWLA